MFRLTEMEYSNVCVNPCKGKTIAMWNFKKAALQTKAEYEHIAKIRNGNNNDVDENFNGITITSTRSIAAAATKNSPPQKAWSHIDSLYFMFWLLAFDVKSLIFQKLTSIVYNDTSMGVFAILSLVIFGIFMFVSMT